MHGPGPMPNMKCSQCGYYHPPVPQGEECPLKKKTDEYGNTIDTTNFFKSLKALLESQIQIKKIKDHKKLFNEIMLGINKTIENFKE